MTELKNNLISVRIEEKGAELKSVVYNGKEQLWQGDPKYWTGTAPVLFPICGGLKEDKFFWNGKEYILPKHGFARKKTFSAEKLSETKAVFTLYSDEETKKVYPFDFEFRVIFELTGSRLETTYEVKNLSADSMYFSVGAHEAYACPEGIEEYDIVFPQEETLHTTILDGNLLTYSAIPVLEGSHILPLKESYFAVDALVYQNLKSRSAALKNRVTGRTIQVDFDGFDFLLLWTKPGAGYICIEPWTGVPDFVDSDCDITKKKGIFKLSPGETCSRIHSILF